MTTPPGPCAGYHTEPPSGSIAPVEAVLCSIWRRGERQEADRSLYFERDRCEGRVEIGCLGLQDNMTFHSLKRNGAGGAALMADNGERALLVQTKQTYAALAEVFPEAKPSLGDGGTPSFGETFILDGFSCKDVCVGDVFKSSESPLTIQVSSPRYACMRVDKRHPMRLDLPSGAIGSMRHYVNGTGLGGILFRVLTPGSAGEGDRLCLLERPHPKWTLEYLASLLFPIAAKSCLKPNWNGSDDELCELCDLQELAYWEWKDVCRKLKEQGVQGINQAALSGDGSLQNVGIRVTGSKKCSDCNQKFETEEAKDAHHKFMHELSLCGLCEEH